MPEQDEKEREKEKKEIVKLNTREGIRYGSLGEIKGTESVKHEMKLHMIHKVDSRRRCLEENHV